MRKNLKITISIIAIGIVGFFLIIFLYKKNIQNSDEKNISAYDEIFEIQKKADIEIENFSKDKNFTLDNPKIILNPYKIAPLTALIIFQTEEDATIEVKVNGNTMTNMEKSKTHLIPIYGMYADYENKIELILNNGDRKELTIKTDKYKGDAITLEKTTESIENNLYFVSPNFVDNCVIDGKGSLVH